MQMSSTVCMVNNSLHPSVYFLISSLATARQLSENRPCVQAIISLILLAIKWPYNCAIIKISKNKAFNKLQPGIFPAVSIQSSYLFLLALLHSFDT